VIEVRELTKRFGELTAIDRLTLSIPAGQVFGLLGTNGAGKTTLLRLIAGILRPDSGTLTLDGQPVFEQPAVKEQLFFIPDNPYWFANHTPNQLGAFFAQHYRNFDQNEYRELLHAFNLDGKRRTETFSKGMNKQLAICCALAAQTRWLLCDETFDGLDPVVRHAVKTLFADRMAARGLTPIIASHNLRELAAMQQEVHKVQAAFPQGLDLNGSGLNVLFDKQSGSIHTMAIRGDEAQILAVLQQQEPVFLEAVPLTLEELFICETEVVGYDFKNLVL